MLSCVRTSAGVLPAIREHRSQPSGATSVQPLRHRVEKRLHLAAQAVVEVEGLARIRCALQRGGHAGREADEDEVVHGRATSERAGAYCVPGFVTRVLALLPTLDSQKKKV